MQSPSGILAAQPERMDPDIRSHVNSHAPCFMQNALANVRLLTRFSEHHPNQHNRRVEGQLQLQNPLEVGRHETQPYVATDRNCTTPFNPSLSADHFNEHRFDMTVPVADRGHEVLAVYGLFVALTTLTATLRVCCRAYLSKHQAFGWDDILALVAWVSLLCPLLKPAPQRHAEPHL